MLKKLFDLTIQSFSLLRDVRETREKTARLQEQIDEIQDSLVELSFKFQLLAEREHREREKLTLQLENALLRAQKTLPTPKPKKRKR
jgi:hypothetical protein